MIGRLAHELRLAQVALQYFTRLPMPAACDFREEWLSESVRYFPLAGVVVGGLSALALAASAAVLPWPLAACIAIVVAIWITGAFHEDGLADTFDALGGHVPRERALAIMRDSRIGTYGAAALILAVFVRWQALATLPPVSAFAGLVCMHAAARAGSALLMAGLAYVRIDDDAKAKPVARPMGAGRAAVTASIGLMPSVIAALLQPHLAIALGAGLGAIVLVHAACRRWFRRRLGGYTGDALGCAEQLGEVAFGLAMVAVLVGGLQ